MLLLWPALMLRSNTKKTERKSCGMKGSSTSPPQPSPKPPIPAKQPPHSSASSPSTRQSSPMRSNYRSRIFYGSDRPIAFCTSRVPLASYLRSVGACEFPLATHHSSPDSKKISLLERVFSRRPALRLEPGFVNLEPMTIQRMEEVGIVVDDLAAAAGAPCLASQKRGSF
jgi:hypothetical protein